MRAMFMPEAIISFRTGREEDDGPIVHTILVCFCMLSILFYKENKLVMMLIPGISHISLLNERNNPATDAISIRRKRPAPRYDAHRTAPTARTSPARITRPCF